MKFAKISALLVIALSAVHSRAAMTPSKYINFQGTRIAAYESTGKGGPGILLVHGNTSSASSFEKIMTSEYAQKKRIVAIDMPGFGMSDNATAYSTGYLAQTVAFVAKELQLDEGVLVGWSLGGDIILQASSLLPYTKGYFIFGTAPLGVDPQLPPPFLGPRESYAGDAVNLGFVGALPPEYIYAYVSAFFKPGFPLPQQFFEAGLRTDPATREAVYRVVIGQDPTLRDEIAIVRNLKKPIAIVLADTDAFVRPAFLNALAPSIPKLYKKTILKVENSGHATQWEQPNKFIDLLSKFVSEI